MPIGAMTANVASNFSDVCQRFHMVYVCSATRARLKGVVRLSGAAVCLALGCGNAALHGPSADLQALAQAVARKDARAVHAMLDQQTQRDVSVEQVALLLARDGNELAQRTKNLADADPRIAVRVGLNGGTQVALSQAEGAYYIDRPGLNGGAALTPMEAIAALRSALEAQSYTALLSVLTPELREQVEQQRKQLIEALRYEEALELTQEGERLLVNTADGHRVILNGKWEYGGFTISTERWRTFRASHVVAHGGHRGDYTPQPGDLARTGRSIQGRYSLAATSISTRCVNPAWGVGRGS